MLHIAWGGSSGTPIGVGEIEMDLAPHNSAGTTVIRNLNVRSLRSIDGTYYAIATPLQVAYYAGSNTGGTMASSSLQRQRLVMLRQSRLLVSSLVLHIATLMSEILDFHSQVVYGLVFLDITFYFSGLERQRGCRDNGAGSIIACEWKCTFWSSYR